MAIKVPETLYHYCSMASFYAIAQSRSIWLSSLLQTNDFLEGKLVARALERVAATDNLNPPDVLSLMDMFRGIESIFEGLALCLSEEPDLLSQWRGYASDANGVAIGFAGSYLIKLGDANRSRSDESFVVTKVEYDQKSHDDRVRPAYLIAKEKILRGAFKGDAGLASGLLGSMTEESWREEIEARKEAHKELYYSLTPLIDDIYRLKSAAFSEEKEWRLLTHTSDDQYAHSSYRVNGDRLIPYVVYELTRQGELEPFVEVILGPRNRTPLKVVEKYLRAIGFANTKVRASSASYR